MPYSLADTTLTLPNGNSPGLRNALGGSTITIDGTVYNLFQNDRGITDISGGVTTVEVIPNNPVDPFQTLGDINTTFPTAKRIPDFAVGDAGEVVAVNPTGTALVIAPVPAGAQGPKGDTGARGPKGDTGATGPAGPGLNQSQVDARISSWAREGNTDLIPYVKMAETLFGDVQSKITSDQQVIVTIAAGAARANLGRVGSILTLTSQQAIAGASIDVSWDFTWVGSHKPADISLELWTNGLTTDRLVNRVNLDLTTPGDNAHGIIAFGVAPRVTGYTIEVYGTGDQDNATSATMTISDINVRYDTGAAATIIRAIVLAGMDNWAHRGDASSIPKHKLPPDVVYQSDLIHGIALNNVSPGLTLSSTNRNSFPTGATLFAPTLDLDTYTHGVLFLSLDVSIAPVSDRAMGFQEGVSTASARDRNRVVAGNIFASRIRAADAVAATGSGITPKGVQAFRLPVFSNVTNIGNYTIFITRNVANQVGYYAFWEAAAGSTGATITATLRALFQPQDTSTAQQPGAGG